MKGYLYVVDETGAEIKGSRRSLAHCETREEFQAIRQHLQAVSGEGCLVLDSEIDRRPDRR